MSSTAKTDLPPEVELRLPQFSFRKRILEIVAGVICITVLLADTGQLAFQSSRAVNPLPVPRHSTLTSQGIAAKSQSRRSLFFL